MEASQPSQKGWPFLPRLLLPVKSPVKFVFVYMRGGPALLSEILPIFFFLFVLIL